MVNGFWNSIFIALKPGSHSKFSSTWMKNYFALFNTFSPCHMILGLCFLWTVVCTFLKSFQIRMKLHIFEADKKRPIYSGLKKNKTFPSWPPTGPKWSEVIQKIIFLGFFEGDFWRIVPWYNNPQTTIFRESIFWEKKHVQALKGRNAQIHSLISPCSNATNRCFGSSYVHRASCSSNTEPVAHGEEGHGRGPREDFQVTGVGCGGMEWKLCRKKASFVGNKNK